MEQRIGHYRIVSELGRGGMGVVYKAHEESLNRFVALKVLGEHLSEDESYVERFVREAQSAASLNHPNIVQVYAIAEHENRHYFAMEFVSGTSIQGLIKAQGKMDPVAAARLIIQAAAGLGAAHELSIVHRDVKPANLMVDRRGLVKITDFGLALLAAGATRLTATGMFMGTPGYLSPEQCLDDTVDHRTDIYSLGVTLYEMLSGKVPFKADSPLALIRQITEVEPPDILGLNPNVPEGLATILRKMMAKDRSQRYADCDAVVEDLRAWLGEVDGADEAMSSIIAAVAATAGAKTAVGALAGATTQDAAPTIRTFDDEPTVHVDSAAVAEDAVAPPPPPPPIAETPPAAAQPSEPVIVATPDEVENPPDSSRTKILLLVAAAVLVFAVAGATGLVMFKRGVFSSSDRTAAAQGDADGSEVAALLDEKEVARPETAKVDADRVITPGGTPLEATTEAGVAQPDPAATEPGSSAAAASSGGVSTTDVGPDRGDNGAGQSPDTTSVRPPITAHESTVPSAGVRAEPSAPEPPRVGRGVAIVSFGEPLLAATAADYVTEALTRRGLEVFDGSGIPGVMSLIEGGRGSDGPNLAELVRPHARWLVVVRAEYTGDRPLSSIAGRDREFQARLHVVAQDLMDGRAFGPGIHAPIGYTHLTVEKKVADLLRPKFRDAAGRMADIGN